MGIQTMASQGGGGGLGQRIQIQSLARQGSLYSLTLNEVQNHLGEPLQSMNLEELLKGLDANQEVDGPTDHYASSSGLQRQGSITMPRALRDKTVDEVWRDIQLGHNNKGSNDDVRLGDERQLTFGEMTLEDFLAKAGVVPEGSNMNMNDLIESDPGQGSHWLNQYQQMPGMNPYHQMSLSSAMSDPQTPGRKRGASSDVADKLVERRQKRMIKNRESAARSRARKQAYTNELENKVSRLEEENERLKKQKDPKQRSVKWIVDSGCSRHMTGNINYFRMLSREEGGTVTFGDNKKANIIGKGIGQDTVRAAPTGTEIPASTDILSLLLMTCS